MSQDLSQATALANPVLQFLGKPCHDVTRADLLKVIENFKIEQLTFHYTGLDGQLHELNLPFSDLDRAQQLLAMGERVDGSSLFKGVVDPANSDLYVIPKYSTVFLNPFVNNSLDFICRFIDSQGNLAAFPPDNLLEKYQQRILKKTGLTLHALGELEFFLVSAQPATEDNYQAQAQGGYHASLPFFKGTDILREITNTVQRCTGAVKYGHAEVGYIRCINSDNPLLDGHSAEQFEVEMRTMPIADMGDYLTLARWIIRNIASQHGMLATFTPKLQVGMAGTGYHVHVELQKDGQNVMRDAQGQMSEYALRIIGGLTRFAQVISAFGNTVASSYLRLVPNQEAPTKICWSFSNRSSLVRIPLGWSGLDNLAQLINPQEDTPYLPRTGSQTVELRSPDGSANTYLLLASIAHAVEWGLTDPKALEYAEDCRIDGDVFRSPKLPQLLSLPQSCAESADILENEHSDLDLRGAFPLELIRHCISVLRAEDDRELNTTLASLPEAEAEELRNKIMHRSLHRN